jgi:RimK family alpha-L-glutamate ligase
MPVIASRVTLVAQGGGVTVIESPNHGDEIAIATMGGASSPGLGRIHVLASPSSEGSVGLVQGWRRFGLDAELLSGAEALELVRPDDVIVGRLDVLPSLDGVEPGLLALFLLERRGARVINTVDALLGVHDKLRSAAILTTAKLPHPQTAAFTTADPALPLRPPCVVKPRFGSWGRGVHRCENESELIRCLEAIREQSWFRRHGALVQELVPAPGRDLRVIVAGGRVVGAAERVAAEGEWRTNVSLGGTLRPTRPSDDAAELARTAAAVVGADLVGVDLLPVAGGGYVVLELNGAVDFDERYAFGDESVFAAVAKALGLA